MSILADLQRLEGDVGELLATHERARSITDFAKYAEDPEGFFHEVLHAPPMWAKQLEMAELVRDGPRTVVLSANGIGKDYLCAHLALWWVYARRGLVVLTSVTERQVKHILMREVRRAWSRAADLPGELFSLELRVDDDVGILAFTSDNADRLVGFHHPRLLVVLSEAQGIADATYEAAFACCTGPANAIFAYGNPTSPSGPFYRVAHSETWARLKISAAEHPNVVTGRSEIPGAVSREWVELMRAEYGETSSIYRSRVCAEFPEDSIEGLVKREWLRAAFDRHEARTASASLEAPVLALDVARFGPDMSCLAVVRGADVEQLITWRGASTTESGDRVIAYAESLSPAKREQVPGMLRYWTDDQPTRRPDVIIDEPGLGAGAIDHMRAKHWQVEAFNGAARAPDPARFTNLRAASHWRFRELLEQGRVALPRDDDLEEEALAVEWTLAPNGTIQVVAKDLVRKTLGRSPDKLDAVVMGLWRSIGAPRQRWGSSTFSM